ncbi:MAG: IMPACT family protein [Bulleidia sp.]
MEVINTVMRIKEEYRKEITVNKSVFIACVRTCRTEDEARAYIDSIRNEFRDATHVCTAYQCGPNQSIQRSNDNREPSGTAGMPMLEAIRNSGLEDVCACAVRYFGGIKLGTGGLVRAYGGCISEALKEAPKCEDLICHQYTVTYPYALSGTIETWLRKYANIRNMMYDEQVSCLFETDRDDIEQTIRDLSRGAAQAVFVKDVIVEKEIIC